MAKDTDIRASVDTKKRTTQVNIFVVLGVLLFIGLAIGYATKISRDPPRTEHDNTPMKP